MSMMKFRKKCNRFFNENMANWSERIFYEAIESKEFRKDVDKVIEESSDNNFDYTELEKMFNYIHQKSISYIKKMKLEEDFDKKFDYSMRAMSYFGLENCLNEHSSYTQKIIDGIKEHFGNEYLNVIQKIDKKYLSIDGKKHLDILNSDLNDEDPFLKMYVVMKEWQDITHYYYLEEIEPVVYKLEEKYLNKYEKSFSKISAYKLRALIKLSRKVLVDINEITNLYIAGEIKNDLINLVGGKTYGLSILNALEINIPKTYVILTNNDEIDKKNLDILDKDMKYAVRSSADIEDGENLSFAGMFNSYLNVSFDEIISKVNLVKESISNKRVNEYLNKKNSNVNTKMAVIIQEFIEPMYSGVWIGENIDSGMLEWVEGNGEKLVSGRVTPKNEKWTSGLERFSEENIKCENNYVGRELLSLQKKVFDLDKNIADFEWCILDNRFVMLQYRPVTIKLSQNYIPNSFSVENNVFKGIPSSKGVFEGSAKFVNAKNHEGIEWNKGDAIMAWFTDPEMMHILIKSGAIITAMGGFLCHGAIIARELEIPCVVGIGSSAMKTIWKDNKIYVDGNTGEVKRLV